MDARSDDGGTEIDVAEEKAENDAGLPHTVPTAGGKNRKPISRFPLCWPSTAHSLDSSALAICDSNLCGSLLSSIIMCPLFKIERESRAKDFAHRHKKTADEEVSSVWNMETAKMCGIGWGGGEPGQSPPRIYK